MEIMRAEAATGSVETVVDGGQRERLRRRLGVAAVVACLPYLGLKFLWVCRVDVGVIDHDRVSGAAWAAANGATFVMDAVAALIAFALSRPGGPRVRPWLIVVPMWIASGLLGVIMLAVPVSLAALPFGAPNPFSGDGFLEPWVYALVYGGFIVEGAVLLGAFALYADERWGVWLRSPVRGTRFTPGWRTAGFVAAGLLAVAAAVRIGWACGVEAGLTAQRIEDLDGVARTVEAVQGLFALAGAVGVFALVGPSAGRVSVRVPVVLAWVGTAVAFGWGGFIGLTGALVGSDHAPSAGMTAVYSAELVAALVAFAGGARVGVGRYGRM
ncbi:hypothetical protein [Yinghuangia seranimata]|uniref:hypothetical protein n=1 Tax=Yinghuangia seranimata TaxID=408067 RepID=UPI00248D2D06|nr:hypothetical protein [Yinghuangia seranimata]MDI2129573.1 hypothetical protein [Yinghuangia seranimata]